MCLPRPERSASQTMELLDSSTAKQCIETSLASTRASFGPTMERNWPFTAIEVKGRNLLVNLTNGNKTVEFDHAGKVVWRVDNSHVGGRFADPCGGQRLSNGNTVICSYGQKKGDMPKLFEVNRKKEVVWEYFNPAVRAHEVHVITTNGEVEGTLK